jgi:DNA-binding response OmpR family regulator
MRIALLHDDSLLPDAIQGALERRHHACHFYQSGASLLKDMRHETYDLLIADWDLADLHTEDVLRRARELLGGQVPTLLLTRRRHEDEVINVLRGPADDFVVKPVHASEVAARVTALLRRAYPQAMGQCLDFGPYRFDPDNRQVALYGETLSLKHREYELALFMFRNAGRLLSRSHLREAVWGDVGGGHSRSLDTHVSRLRALLQLTQANGFTVTAIYGMGYRLDAVGAADAQG